MHENRFGLYKFLRQDGTYQEYVVVIGEGILVGLMRRLLKTSPKRLFSSLLKTASCLDEFRAIGFFNYQKKGGKQTLCFTFEL